MPYKLIKGEFHIFYPDRPRQGPEPDGDTLKFLPDNPGHVENLYRPGTPSPRFNGRMMINLRFEGIDALEIHFDDMHQDLTWAEKARDYALQKVGFGEVQFWSDQPFKVKSVQNHPRRGYILARTLDVNGRIVSFVYPGTSDREDGTDVFLDVPLLNKSLNAQLIASGLVYPAFYITLPVELKDRFAEMTVQARDGNHGLWSVDTANVDHWASIPNLSTLQTLAICPKLFRRLARFFAAGHTGIKQFDVWLRADPRDRDDRVLLPNRELGNMHDLIEIDDNRIRMFYRTEDIVILPDDA